MVKRTSKEWRVSSDTNIDPPGDTKTDPLVDVKNPRVCLGRRP